MNTPIIDAASKEAMEFDALEYVVSNRVAYRLETDRAALMEALEAIVNSSDVYVMRPFLGDNARSALAAARANFPTP